MRIRTLPVLALFLLATARSTAGPILIDYEDGQGIRRHSSGTLAFLNGLSVMLSSFEDRTVLEYPLSSLQGAITEAYLDLWVQNFDPGGPAGLIDVYVYTADGQVALAEFFSGTFAGSIASNIGYAPASFDVTGLIATALDAGHSHIGFRLSTAGLDRFIVGSTLVPSPVLRVIPEPSSAVIAALLLVCLSSRRTARRA